jgi:hypothetical protein
MRLPRLQPVGATTGVFCAAFGACSTTPDAFDGTPPADEGSRRLATRLPRSLPGGVAAAVFCAAFGACDALDGTAPTKERFGIGSIGIGSLERATEGSGGVVKAPPVTVSDSLEGDTEGAGGANDGTASTLEDAVTATSATLILPVLVVFCAPIGIGSTFFSAAVVLVFVVCDGCAEAPLEAMGPFFDAQGGGATNAKRVSFDKSGKLFAFSSARRPTFFAASQGNT